MAVPRVLVACEESLVVNSRLTASGWVASVSCDWMPPEHLGCRHLCFDVLEVLGLGFDCMLAFPTCRMLCLCSSMYLLRPGRKSRLARAAQLFDQLYHAPGIPFIAIENPRQNAVARATLRVHASQEINPYDHSHSLTKPTQLYLRGLPLLVKTHPVSGRLHTIARMSPNPLRSMIKGRTFAGISRAMVEQWVPVLVGKRCQALESVCKESILRRFNLRYGVRGDVSDSKHPDQEECRLARLDAEVVASAFSHAETLGLTCPATPTLLRSKTPTPLRRVGAFFREWKTLTERQLGRLLVVHPLIRHLLCRTAPTPIGSWPCKQCGTGTTLPDHSLNTRPRPGATCRSLH